MRDVHEAGLGELEVAEQRLDLDPGAEDRGRPRVGVRLRDPGDDLGGVPSPMAWDITSHEPGTMLSR